MAKSDAERKRDQRERKKLGLVHINDWIELEFASVYKALKAIYADKSKKLWKQLMEVIKNYKG